MHPLVNIGISAARRAGDLITRAVLRPDTIKVIRDGQGQATLNIATMAQHEIMDALHVYDSTIPVSRFMVFPKSYRREQDEYLWLINPLCGQDNFIRGFLHFAISIAFLYKNRIEHGIIYDPVRQDLFVASRNKGAQLNNQRIRVSGKSKLEHSLIAVGSVPAGLLSLLAPLGCNIRQTGCPALDLAYNAAGKLDGFIVANAKANDVASGILLMQEAGGLVRDFDNEDQSLSNGNIVVGSGTITKSLLQALAGSRVDHNETVYPS